MIRRRVVSVVAVLAVAGLLIGYGTSASGASSGGTLQLWLSGDLTQATPGSPYRQWVNMLVSRFEKQNPGWKINFTLLTYDPAQETAKLVAAFGSNSGPDLLSLYTGQFTNTFKSELLPLNKYIMGTKGLYSSIPEGIWNVECIPNYTCNKGKSTILGVPWNAGAYFMYYNKALLAKAGISQPPATYSQLFADCKKLSAKGITAFAMGANDGYDTSNYWTSNLVSTLQPGDVQKLGSGKLPYNTPAAVAALTPILQLTAPSSKCTSSNALGEGQLQGTQDFQAGKAAMTGFYSLSLVPFKKALGTKLGVARLPVSGNGPLLKVNNGYAGTPWDGWVINKRTKYAAMAWKFVQIASDATANQTAQNLMGFSPANPSVSKGLTDPLEKAANALAANPAIPELDMVMPNAYALDLYRELSLGQEQKQSAKQTLDALENYVKSNPQP